MKKGIDLRENSLNCICSIRLLTSTHLIILFYTARYNNKPLPNYSVNPPKSIRTSGGSEFLEKQEKTTKQACLTKNVTQRKHDHIYIYI
jgi:hypothetical protein